MQMCGDYMCGGDWVGGLDQVGFEFVDQFYVLVYVVEVLVDLVVWLGYLVEIMVE